MMGGAPADPAASADDPFASIAAPEPMGNDDWMTGGSAPAPAPAPSPLVMSAPAPSGSGFSLQAPTLEQVSPGIDAIGGARRELSELVLDVEVQVDVCFGDASLTVEEFLDMGRGSVIELDHAVDMPVELRVKDRIVARGQLVTINGNYGLRITDMVSERGNN
jgi:flagellar motor switch protein FliN